MIFGGICLAVPFLLLSVGGTLIPGSIFLAFILNGTDTNDQSRESTDSRLRGKIMMYSPATTA